MVAADRLTRARLAAIVECSEDAILSKNLDGTITTWNAAAERLFGYPGDEIIGQLIWKIIPQERHQEELVILDRLFKGERIAHYETERLTKAGARLNVLLTISPLMGSAGQIVGASTIIRDTTAQKQAENALKEKQECFRAFFELSFAGLSISENGRFLEVNDQLTQILGCERNEIIGAEFVSFIAPDCRELVFENIRLGREAWADYRILRKDGSSVMVEAHERTVNIMGRDLRFTTLRDITRRNQAEGESVNLRDRLTAELQSMNRLHALSTRFVRGGELQPLLDDILDTAIAITSADKGQFQLFNAPHDELNVAAHRGLNQEFIEFFSHIRPGVAACGTAMQRRQCVVIEDVALSPVFLATPRAQELMLANGVRAVVCTPLLTRTGQFLGVLSTHYAAPCRASERDLHLLDMLARQAADFVERLHSEKALQGVRDELAQANADLERKVRERTVQLQETIGDLNHFSNTLVHDMRAPLRAMQGFADMLLQECDACPNAKNYIRRISTAANRMDQLIIDALDYSKAMQQEIPLLAVDADALLRGMLETYPNFQRPNAEITIDGVIPQIWGNQAALTQCFSNLLGNAVKFVKPGTVAKVRVWVEISQTNSEIIRLWFEDNGIGIHSENRDRIFEMFQRVSREFEGTGIGLALVRKVTQQMGGKVGVESEPGRGSRFWLEFKRVCPIQQESPQANETFKQHLGP